jgi:hypothetical protein
MVEAMKSVASLDMELTVEERNLLSVAYKNVIGNAQPFKLFKNFTVKINKYLYRYPKLYTN